MLEMLPKKLEKLESIQMTYSALDLKSRNPEIQKSRNGGMERWRNGEMEKWGQ